MMTFCFNHCLNEVECEENINLILRTLLVAHSRLGVSTQYPIILPSGTEYCDNCRSFFEANSRNDTR